VDAGFAGINGSRRISMLLEMKTCKKCGAIKPRKAFSKRPDMEDGRSSWCRKCHAQASLRTRRKDPEKYWLGQASCRRKRKYGLTEAVFQALLKAQKHQCKICLDSLTGFRNLHVDHCHRTDKVRGLLCAPCNKGLAFFKDSVRRLHAAIGYLSAS